MSVVISGKVVGQKRVSVQHEPSGVELITTAPKDNGGDGDSFSATDLIAGGLGSCMLLTMCIFAERHEINLSGASFRVEKVMADKPRRISDLKTVITLPESLSSEQRLLLERAAQACPVHRSLHPEINIAVEFLYC